MSSITFANLRTAVRERADMVNDTDFITEAELGRIINGEAAELHDLVVSRFEDDFTISAEVTVSSGTYALSGLSASAPFYKLRAVDRSVGGQWSEVERFDFNRRNRTAAATGYLGPDVQYRLIGTSLHFTPSDQAAGTYRLWYIPSFVDLSADGDTLSYPENWHEMVIAGAAAKCLLKEESDAREHLAIKADVKRRIMAAATNRDAGASHRIQDVRGRSRTAWRDW